MVFQGAALVPGFLLSDAPDLFQLSGADPAECSIDSFLLNDELQVAVDCVGCGGGSSGARFPVLLPQGLSHEIEAVHAGSFAGLNLNGVIDCWLVGVLPGGVTNSSHLD